MSARHARQIDNVSENIAHARIRDSKSRRVQQSYVQLEPGPAAHSRESARMYSRRRNRTSIIEDSKKKSRIRNWVIAAIVILAAIIIAVLVGVQVFIRTTDSKLAMDDSSVSNALVSAESGQPFYMLCLADLKNPTYSYSTAQDEACMLVRVDEAAKSIGFVSIPSHMYMKDSSGNETEISQLMENSDYAGLLDSISTFAGVSISHIGVTNFKMLESLVDAVGGVDVDIPQEIDDPIVGAKVIRAGHNSLDSTSALEMVRSTNLLGGFEATAQNRALFMEALMSRVLDSSNQIELASVVSDAANYLDTDWKSSDILSFADNFQPFDSITFYNATLPCSASKDDAGEVVYTCNSTELKAFLATFTQGQDASEEDAGESSKANSDISVEVRNGAGIDGAAAALGAILENNGYTVKKVGNTNDNTTYPETLVVFTDTGSEEEAVSVIGDIGAGRAVEGGDYYSSSADIIVIIGTDWA